MKVSFLAAFSIVFLAGCMTSPVVPPQNVRVMTYNIHHGEGADGKIDLDRIAGLILQEKVDVVALQEVDRGVERSSRRDIIKELSQLTGMKFCFGKNITYQGGDYGNAVLTRFPVLKSKNVHFKMLRPSEQRGVLQLLLNVNGKKLLFMNTHIDYRPDDEERKLNVHELRQWIEREKRYPILLCGDFNSTPDSEIHTQMSQFMIDSWKQVGEGNGFSFSSTEPDRRIDYIWFTPANAVGAEKANVLITNASDHLPVVVDLLLR